MKLFHFGLILFLALVLGNELIAQDLKENEIVVIKGEKYILHQVRTGETIYSISRNFKVNRDALLQHNPKISEGLDIGEILKIPYNEGVDLEGLVGINKGDPTSFKFHTIKSRKETPYFIAKQYGITVEELYSYNPEIRKFKKREKIRIPVWEIIAEPVKEEIVEEVTDVETKQEMHIHTVLSGETLFSISKKYNIPVSEILFQNPEAKNLKAGAKIYLPKSAIEDAIIEEKEPVMRSTNYFEHIIESCETMWGTIRKYNVSEEELKELNPVLRTAFPAGVVIKIPVKDEIEKTQAKPLNEGAFLKHVVEKGETLYGVAAQYALTVPEIQKYNPVLEKRNLVKGEIILIPQKITNEIVEFIAENPIDSVEQVEAFYKVELPVEIPESCLPAAINSNEVYNVALFLPLYLEANYTLNRESIDLEEQDSILMTEIEMDQDTVIEEDLNIETFKKFYKNSESFMQFYEGVLLAVDSMQNSGMNIVLSVFDTQRNSESIRQFIYSEDFLETDLIIGPVYESVQKDVAQIAAKNRIPIVSPLASQSKYIGSNSNYYQIVPSREYIAEKTAEMISEEYFNSNFIVVKTKNYNGTPEGKMVELIQEKFFNSGFMSKQNGVSFTEYDFKNEGPAGLRRIMSKSKENVIFIPTSNEGELSVTISNINNLADDYSITMIGSNRYQNYQSINIEQYHNLKLKYIDPYWMDFNNRSTVCFAEKFKLNFGTEPNRFGAQGFDVAFYFLSAIKYYGKDFNNCLPYLHIDLVQGNYHFEKVSQFGGYMNQGVSIISYTRDYEVKRTRIKGQPALIADY